MRARVKAFVPPRVLASLRRYRGMWRTRNPSTFDEKVRYKIYRDRRRMLVTFADKLGARSYVTDHAPSCALTAVYGVATDLRTVDRATLPREFVVKVSHASGGVVVVSEAADAATPTPTPDGGLVRTLVHPDRLDWDLLCRTTDEWLRTAYDGPLGEWAYSEVPRRVFVEELLADPDGRPPTDYKLWVFHGRCEVVEVGIDRFRGLKELLFTREWNVIADSPGDAEAADGVAPPDALPQLIAVAEQLGAATDFVRVDLYECGGRVYFGELTNYPGGGDSLSSPAVDRRLGQLWRVPRRYKEGRVPNGA